MKKAVTLISAITIFTGIALVPANAHVGVQLRGNTLEAGKSSRIYLSLGHGCSQMGKGYPTSVFSVKVPAAAGKPTPEFHYGFKTTVIASTTVDAASAPTFYTVTWTAKTLAHAIDDGTFYDFGLKVKWASTPQVIPFETTQTCYGAITGGKKKPLYLSWTITDGSTKSATADTEFGPAPSVTTVKVG